MLFLFIFACSIKAQPVQVQIGVVDIVDPAGCEIQLVNEKMIYVNSPLCARFTEGDILLVQKRSDR